MSGRKFDSIIFLFDLFLLNQNLDRTFFFFVFFLNRKTLEILIEGLLYHPEEGFMTFCFNSENRTKICYINQFYWWIFHFGPLKVFKSLKGIIGAFFIIIFKLFFGLSLKFVVFFLNNNNKKKKTNPCFIGMIYYFIFIF